MVSPNAIDLLRDNPDKIDWYWLSSNKSPNAIDLLRDNPEKINWDWLSANKSPNAIELLRANPDKIYWINLSKHPAIFKLDYQKLKENKRELNQTIIAEAWCPRRVAKWIEQGFDLEEL